MKWILVTWFVTILLGSSAEMSIPNNDNTILILSENDAYAAFQNLKTGQTIQFGLNELRLNKRLVVSVENVIIRGALDSTILHCPDATGILLIRAVGVGLHNLEFNGCHGPESALQIEGRQGIQKTSVANRSAPGVDVISCSFINNTGSSALVATWSHLRILSTKFRGNLAKSDGGAIYSANGSLSIDDSVLEYNLAGNRGGAVLVIDGNLSISSSEFVGNRIGNTSSVVYGRHFSNDNPFATDGSSVYAVPLKKDFPGDKNVGNGGAVAVVNGEVYVASATFADNSANSLGGALSAGGLCKGHIAGSTFINNSAAGNGGAIALSNTGWDVEKEKLYVVQSRFENNSAGYCGGAVYGDRSASRFVLSYFLRNRANQRGGAIFLPLPPAVISGCHFIENSAGQRGGAVIKESVFKFVITESTFQGNYAVKEGGAIYYGSITEIFRTAFNNNVADTYGGALYAHSARSTITSCNFSGNHGGYGAGAVNVYEGSVIIDSSTFHDNVAKKYNGGALILNLAESKIYRSRMFRNSATGNGGCLWAYKESLITKDCEYVDNRADKGGAMRLAKDVSLTYNNVSFIRNIAGTGGALSLGTHCTCYPITSHIFGGYFEENEAEFGGAISCFVCGFVQLFRVNFDANIAYKYGGAVLFAGGQALHHIERAIFSTNVAQYGGALAFVNCSTMLIDNLWNNKYKSFVDNVALVGGAIYIETTPDMSQSHTLRNIHFRENRALTLNELMHNETTPVVRKWLDGRERLGLITIADLNCTNCKDGRGGAVYLLFRDLRASYFFDFTMRAVDIANCSAAVGGAAYIEFSSADGGSTITQEKCSLSWTLDSLGCIRFNFISSIFGENYASVAGGGLFMSTPPNDIADLYLKQPEEKLADFMQEMLTDLGTLIAYLTIPLVVGGNGIDADAYGKNLATDAMYLKRSNGTDFLGTFKVGQLLSLQIYVKDFYGNDIRGRTKDADMLVMLHSSKISGQMTYQAVNGVITIDNTRIEATSSVNETLVISTKDDRDISLSLRFAINECPEGEVQDETSGRCFHCGYNSYTFMLEESIDNCKPCEPNAICTGGIALIPKDGYWHSSPYSPFFWECLSEKACSRPNRNDLLLQYYRNFSTVQRDLHALMANVSSNEIIRHFFNRTLYPQCSDDSEGFVCGSCAAGYGRALDGTCSKCRYNRGTSITLTIMLAAVVLMVYRLRLFLTIEAIKSEITTGEQGHPDAASEQVQNIQNPTGDPESAHANGNTTRSPSVEASSSGPPQAADNNNVGSNQQPIQVEPEEHPPANSAKAVAILSETFNILFNYAQLSSIALTLDVRWGIGMRQLLQVQHSIGRLTGSIGHIPFECNFKHTEERLNSRAMISLWYKALFPVAVILISLFIQQVARARRARLSHQTSSQQSASTSERTADLLSPRRATVLIVLTSAMIDMASYLAKVPNCMHLDGMDGKHDYASFDIVWNQMRGKWLWKEDTKLQCWTPSHLSATIIAVCLFVALVGILVFLTWVLRNGFNRNSLDETDFQLKYGFLFQSYKREGLALYWTIILTTRSILIALLSVYTQYGIDVAVQIGSITIVVFCYTMLFSVVQPFNLQPSTTDFPTYAWTLVDRLLSERLRNNWKQFNMNVSMNGLENTSLHMSLLIFITAMLISGDDSLSWPALVFFLTICYLSNFLFLLFMFYRMWYGVHQCLDTKFQLSEADRAGCLSKKLYTLGISGDLFIDIQTYLTDFVSWARTTANALIEYCTRRRQQNAETQNDQANDVEADSGALSTNIAPSTVEDTALAEATNEQEPLLSDAHSDT